MKGKGKVFPVLNLDER